MTLFPNSMPLKLFSQTTLIQNWRWHYFFATVFFEKVSGITIQKIFFRIDIFCRAAKRAAQSVPHEVA
jgi:hypothetical protein